MTWTKNISDGGPPDGLAGRRQDNDTKGKESSEKKKQHGLTAQATPQPETRR
jgi:hypothetical protein